MANKEPLSLFLSFNTVSLCPFLFVFSLHLPLALCSIPSPFDYSWHRPHKSSALPTSCPPNLFLCCSFFVQTPSAPDWFHFGPFCSHPLTSPLCYPPTHAHYTLWDLLYQTAFYFFHHLFFFFFHHLQQCHIKIHEIRTNIDNADDVLWTQIIINCFLWDFWWSKELKNEKQHRSGWTLSYCFTVSADSLPTTRLYELSTKVQVHKDKKMAPFLSFSSFKIVHLPPIYNAFRQNTKPTHIHI